MLSPADDQLVRRDPALPGLATVLDAEAIVALLHAANEDTPWGAAKSGYLRYKPGTSCIACYQVQLGAEVVDVSAWAFPEDERDKFRKMAGTFTLPGALPNGHILLEDRSVLISSFPNDRRITSLGMLADQQARTELLTGLFPRRPELWNATLRRLRYKPDRRYVAALCGDNGDPSAVLKLYGTSSYRAENSRAFKARHPLQLARLIARSNRYQAVAFEWVSGRGLGELLTLADPPVHEVAMVGAAVAELHKQSHQRLTQLPPRREFVSVLAVGNDLADLVEHAGPRIEAVANCLASLLELHASFHQPIHGDFYAGQILVGEQEAALLDLDNAALSFPEIDLGNFMAHVEFDARRGAIPTENVPSIRQALLEGYSEATRRPNPELIELCTASALLRLAPSVFRDRYPDWPRHIEQILERVETIADGLPDNSSARSAGVTLSEPSAVSAVRLIDSYGVLEDPRLSRFGRALDPETVQGEFRTLLSKSQTAIEASSLRSIRVTRYKPGRRCLIEYDFPDNGNGPPVTLIGKIRANKLDKSTYRLTRSLREAGFVADSPDGVAVPKPVGMIRELHMWVQEKVPGRSLVQLLSPTADTSLANRVAEAISKLHRAGIPTRRRYTIANELHILHDRLTTVVETHPNWESRIRAVLAACDALAERHIPSTYCGIHRDFYPDQIIIDGAHVYLLDLDLYTQGDPAVDIGNFIAHLIEYGLRRFGDPESLADFEDAFQRAYLDMSEAVTDEAVTTYTTLSLVRHIYLSTRFPQRRPLTPRLLELSEQRLGLGSVVRK